MATIGSMIVNVLADTSKYVQNLKGAGKATAGFAAGLKPLQGALASLGVTLSAGAFFGAIRNTQEALDELSKSASKIGLTGQALRELRHAADLSGVGVDQLQAGLARMMRTIGTKSGGKSADQLLAEVADQVDRIADPSMKIDLVTKIFGKAGADFLPLLEGGAQALKGLREQLQAPPISQEELKRVEEFNDVLTNIKSTFAGAFQKFVIDATPEAAGFAEDMRFAMEVFEGFLKVQRAVGGFVGAAASQAVSAPGNLSVAVQTEMHRQRQRREGLLDAQQRDRPVIVQPAGL